MPVTVTVRVPVPMYASIGTQMPVGPDWSYEQKYDGMRVVALASAKAARLVTRNGREKSAQFPEIASALRAMSRRARRTLIVDGEIVALKRGRPAAFQALQPRMQLKDPDAIREQSESTPSALVMFDLLRDGRTDLTGRPWRERRQRLEQLPLGHDPRIRISESSSNGRRMLAAAKRRGWEGVIAKQANAPYLPGVRSGSWLKLKLQHRAEFVVGGYTEPRRSREALGALLLGYFDESARFCYVGHMGGGFTRTSLHDMLERLKPLERRQPPFANPVKTNEPAHWVEPRVVVEVKFAEWTADGKLRQPIFLGVRDDKNARDVGRERESFQEWTQGIVDMAARPKSSRRSTKQRRGSTARRQVSVKAARNPILRQLEDIEKAGGDGAIDFGRGKTLRVTSLGKLYFPETGVTKGELMRYYASIASVILPAIKDRPLVLKRYPDGIDGPSFFQQNAGEVPEHVRTARVVTEAGTSATRIIGGDLLTLLYTVQIGTIAVHAWQTRVGHLKHADTSTVDLDPGDDVPFRDVVALAARIRKLLTVHKLEAGLKTSGSSGLHIVLPLPPRTPFSDAGTIAATIAQRIVESNPDRATLERGIRDRPAGTIYVDAQQNAEGKSVVAAYSVRARSEATVSAPIAWTELRAGLTLERFTLETMPMRLRRVGDLWSAAIKRRNSRRALDGLLGGL